MANKVLTESLSLNDADVIAKQMNALAASGAYSFFMTCDAYRAAKLKKAFEGRDLTCTTDPDIGRFPASYSTTLTVAWG